MRIQNKSGGSELDGVGQKAKDIAIEVQKFRGSEVQKFRSSEDQKFRSSEVQKLVLKGLKVLRVLKGADFLEKYA